MPIDSTSKFANSPTFRNFEDRGTAQFINFSSEPGANLQTAASGAGQNVANQLRGAGSTALGQSLASLNELFANQGALDPRIVNQLQSGVLRGTQQAGLANEGFAARSGIRGPGQSAVQAAIGQGGQNRLTGLNASLAQQQQQRILQLIGLTTGAVTNPAVQFGGIGQGAQNQQDAISAQQGDPLLQALGIGLGAASNAFIPGSGGLTQNAFAGLTEGELDELGRIG